VPLRRNQTDRLARQEGHAILTLSFPPPPSSNDYQRRQYCSAPPVGQSDHHVTSRLPGMLPRLSCHGRYHVFLPIRCLADVVLRPGSGSSLRALRRRPSSPARMDTETSSSLSLHLLNISLSYIPLRFCVLGADCRFV
jgi:hypothetical protein